MPPSPRRSSASLATLVLALCASVLAGCPSSQTSGGDPPATCAKAGEPCTFSPGKLGFCIESVDGSAVAVCQSQH